MLPRVLKLTDYLDLSVDDVRWQGRAVLSRDPSNGRNPVDHFADRNVSRKATPRRVGQLGAARSVDDAGPSTLSAAGPGRRLPYH